MGKTRLASAAYSRAAELDPENADAWYHLGVSYLEQVEADARILLSAHRDSAYVQTLIAETFAEQRAFIQAEEAYKKVLAFPADSCQTHMQVMVLSCSNQHDLEGAERELNAELASNPGSSDSEIGPGAAASGTGCRRKGSKGNRRNMENRPGFARSNAWWFSAGLAGPKRGELLSALHELQASGDIPPETETLFVDASRENLLTCRGEPRGPAARPEAAKSRRRCSKTLRERQLRAMPGRAGFSPAATSQSRTYSCWLRALISVAII